MVVAGSINVRLLHTDPLEDAVESAVILLIKTAMILTFALMIYAMYCLIFDPDSEIENGP